MNIEEKVKMNLLTRGFDNKTQLNNRGLIGATIDETILGVVKNLRIADVSGSLPTEEQIREGAEEWVFDINGMKWSNNDNTAGDNYASFIAGVNWLAKQLSNNH